MLNIDMSRASRDIVDEAAEKLAIGNVTDASRDNYNDLLEFLMVEDGEQHVLPHYFACLFVDNEEKAVKELKRLMNVVLTSMAQTLRLGKYVDEVHKAVKSVGGDSRGLFEKYLNIKSLKGQDKQKAVDEFMV